MELSNGEIFKSRNETHGSNLVAVMCTTVQVSNTDVVD
jgi:hypothetical protein